MLRSVLSTVPGIYRFCHICYSNPSILKFDDRTILSQEGPHQGDPLGSLFFCVSIHPDLLRLQYELVAGFMDDLTLDDPSDVVAADLDYINGIQDDTGLRINASKSEIISHGSRIRALSQWHRKRQSSCEHLFLLVRRWTTFLKTAAPISTPQSAGCLCVGTRRTLLKMSFSAPKMLHTLRCSPCVNHPCVEMFDNLLRKGRGTSCNLDLTDLQCLQASLSVKDGGLNMHRVSSLASSAFLSSVAATGTLQQELLFRSSIAGTTDASVSMVRDEWSSAFATDCPTGPAATKQSTWDEAVTALERQTVINSLSNATYRARLLHIIPQ